MSSKKSGENVAPESGFIEWEPRFPLFQLTKADRVAKIIQFRRCVKANGK